MRLSLKISLITVFGVMIALAGDGYFRAQRERERLQVQLERNQRAFGHALALAAGAAADRHGTERAVQLLRDVNEREPDIQIDWVPEPPASNSDVAAVDRDASLRDSLTTFIPLALDVPGQLVLRQGLADEPGPAARALRTTLTLMLFSALVIFATDCWFLGIPLHGLVQRVRQLRAVDSPRFTGVHRSEELTELAVSVNALSTQLALARQREHHANAVRSAAIERLTGTYGWLLLGKLTAAVGAQADVPPGELALQLRPLLAYASGWDARRPSTVDLGMLAKAAAELFAPIAQAQGVRIQLASDLAAVMAHVRADQILQLLGALVLNAIQAQPNGGCVRISAHADCRPFLRDGLKIGRRSYVCLVVDDQGVGMTPEIQEHMFEPLFTTRRAEEGSGLGLAAVAAIVAEHGGFIGVETGPQEGTQIAVFLPHGLPRA